MAALVGPGGQMDPCTYGAASGPHNSAAICQQACDKFKCAPDSCGNNRCVPDATGPYTYQQCQAACDDPCNMPCSFQGASAPGIYSIDGCAREICVKYVAMNGRPIRVQIWGPIMVNGCPQPNTRVIKTDSQWRCEECCDCPDTPPRSNDPGECEGGGKGQITWNKPRGVTSFEVAVLTACGAAYKLDIQACEECELEDDVGPCACEGDGDCAPDCICCDEECVKKDDIPPGKCCGPCDEENPCPEGCVCVDGTCQYRHCPPFNIIGWTDTFVTGGSCDGPGFINDIQGQTQIAQTWMNNIANWMNSHGYSGATGVATPPSEPTCTACVGPNGDCDLWGSVIFGVPAGCCGTLGGKFINEPPFLQGILDVFDAQVFPGAFYWSSISETQIPVCCHGECEAPSDCLDGCDCVDGQCAGSNPFI